MSTYQGQIRCGGADRGTLAWMCGAQGSTSLVVLYECTPYLLEAGSLAEPFPLDWLTIECPEIACGGLTLSHRVRDNQLPHSQI